MFTSRDLLGELARYPNKADALKTRTHEFMIPLNRMIYASAKDSLYQCLLVMSELKVVGVFAWLLCVETLRDGRFRPNSNRSPIL